jgi:hypothetical protein
MASADERPGISGPSSPVRSNGPADEEYPHQKGGNLHHLFDQKAR